MREPCGQPVHEQDHGDQDGCACIRFVDIEAFLRQGVQVHGHGACRIVQAAGGLGEGAGRKDEGGGFAENASGCQDSAGQDAGKRGGQDDFRDGAQLAGSQPKAAFPIAHGHLAEGFLGRFHDGRQDHDGQGERAGQQRQSHAEKPDKEQGSEQTVHDGGNAGERVDHEPYKMDDAAFRIGVFDQINGSGDAGGQRDGQREHEHEQRVDDGGQHRYVAARIFP